MMGPGGFGLQTTGEHDPGGRGAKTEPKKWKNALGDLCKFPEGHEGNKFGQVD